VPGPEGWACRRLTPSRSPFRVLVDRILRFVSQHPAARQSAVRSSKPRLLDSSASAGGGAEAAIDLRPAPYAQAVSRLTPRSPRQHVPQARPDIPAPVSSCCPCVLPAHSDPRLRARQCSMPSPAALIERRETKRDSSMRSQAGSIRGTWRTSAPQCTEDQSAACRACCILRQGSKGCHRSAARSSRLISSLSHPIRHPAAL
jgi:hypothetical protein